MMMKRWMRRRLSDFLMRRGLEIVPSRCLYEWQRNFDNQPRRHTASAPDEALAYLTPQNPILVDLQKRYSAFDAAVTAPFLWNQLHVRAEDIPYFRGDNGWVFQVRGNGTNIMGYALSFYYLRSIDRLGLLDKLVEDESFGNFTFKVAGRLVSRDLLDSIAEIYFLDRHLRLGSRIGFRVLDIGAGYGRLAHRMVSALDGVECYLCTDAVAASTFVSEYYLRFRGVSKAVVVPLDEIDTALCERPIDLAINIHSFSECRLEAIEWWIRILSKHRVKNLMIVPNTPPGGAERMLTNDGQDFLPILERHGYRTIAKEPKYLDPAVQEFGLEPSWNHLLELSA
jgi:hypothetical protein